MCDVKNCTNLQTVVCFECDPVRILCNTHDNELHVNGGIQHTRKPFAKKCHFATCTKPVLAFCTTQHKVGYCDNHNQLVHLSGHKCHIVRFNCDLCSPPCNKCKNSLIKTCNVCTGTGFFGLRTFACMSCYKGKKICSSCEGKGHSVKSYMYGRRCEPCNGKGELICTYCDNGKEQCYSCRGKKVKICSCVEHYAKKGCDSCGKFKYINEWQNLYNNYNYMPSSSWD
jgi:hypothetical protein